jgi:UDP-2,4-diacetamido-2,4,6-trideoxy-beta-L-altropyranose hydrolase
MGRIWLSTVVGLLGDLMRVVAFRTDASLQIGIGHLMRCLTLADALRERGVRCIFICREHQGHLISQIRARGFELRALPAPSGAYMLTDDQPAHTAWLGVAPTTDAQQTLAALDGITVDWLVVDHYALDARWEKQLRPACRRLLAIDDLADRAHDVDLLLDQNLGRNARDYLGLLPEGCETFIGPVYALLRPEFARLRSASLQRRCQPELRHLLVTMGGVDKDNATGQVLQALRHVSLPKEARVTVVMGRHAPWLEQIRALAKQMPWATEVRVDACDMAELIMQADLAIGAAGSTSWERCCLGLPTLMTVLADNQKEAARALENAGAATVVQLNQNLLVQIQTIVNRLVAEPALLTSMAHCAFSITEGDGCIQVTAVMSNTAEADRKAR